MGEVYEAEDQVLGERVALKFLSRRSVGDDVVLRRFRREIQLARKVTHPNVCRLFDVYEHRVSHGLTSGHDVAFVTMELLPGDTLEAAIQRDGAMTEEQALPLVEQMATALEAAHRVGIIHRDFKSSNVMLVPTEEGRVRAVVTDFGLAQSLDRQDPGGTPLTDELKLVGTPDYMSPEQLRGAELAEQSDVYSLGVVLFEMTTGHHPYEAENTMALLVKRVSEPPRRPRQLNPAVSELWEEVILLCLDGDPSRRPPSPSAVAAALTGRVETPVSGLEVGMPPSSTGPTVGMRRRWWLAIAIAGLALALALILVVRRPGRSTLGTFSPVQLTTGPGLELDPAFSPDGEAMAYSAEVDGQFALFVRELVPGGAETRLTFGAGQAFEPSWAPDGRTIVFHDASRGGLWQVPTSGGRAEQLAEFGSRPAFAPDGKTIAFQTESRPALADTAAAALAQSRLWLLDVPASVKPRALTVPGTPPGSHGAPAFSPRADRVVFTSSQRGRSQLWSVLVSGGAPTPLVQDPATVSDPVWSPGGEYVYFSASVRQVHGLWRVPVSERTGMATGAAEQIANVGLASIRQLDMTQDLRRVAYSAVLTRSNLWSFPIDPQTHLRTGPPRMLTKGNGRSNRPAWSPDGEWIAFDRWQLGVNLNIWIIDRAGENLRQVTTTSQGCSQSSWLGASDRLGFMTLEENQRQLAAMDLASAQMSVVADLPNDADWALLSPDAQHIAFHTRGDGDVYDVWVRDLPSGEARQITRCEGSCSFPVWSPDGAWLALQERVGGNSQVLVVSSTGGETRQLTFGSGQSWPFSFSPDSERIAFAGQRENRWSLWWVARTSGAIQRLTDADRPNAYARYPAWSPRGDEIVFESAETVGDIWLVEDFLDSTD